MVVTATATVEERLLRIEGMLGLRPNLRIAGGSEFWIIQGAGDKANRSLDYYGPFPTAEQAANAKVGDSPLFRPEFGSVIAEVPV